MLPASTGMTLSETMYCHTRHTYRPLASLDRLERALHRRYGYDRADIMIVIGRVRFIFARHLGRSSRSERIAVLLTQKIERQVDACPERAQDPQN